jgi:polysaccharide deacetylase family protein (PEP-CTERM system associated)
MSGAPSALSFTLDLEDHRPNDGLPKRYPEVTRRLLGRLEEWGVRGTFFVVGEVARDEPGLVRDIARAGHEIAFHSLDHVPLDRTTPAVFETATRAGKAALEDITGAPITGFRAPIFSLTGATVWAVDVLDALGFRYSSSVLPAASPLYGYPGAPETPFRWPNGLIEIPVPIARIGPLTAPYLGGIYLRYLPLGLIRRLLARNAEGRALWTYCHPYDFDPDEPYFRMRDTAWWVNVLLRQRRRHTERKIADVMALCGGATRSVPLGERVAAGDFTDAAVFTP